MDATLMKDKINYTFLPLSIWYPVKLVSIITPAYLVSLSNVSSEQSCLITINASL